MKTIKCGYGREEKEIREIIHSKCVFIPGVLAPFHWTVRSPVPGLDSRLRSVGGDRAGNTQE